MDYTIEYGPSYALGIVTLAPGESLQAEAGAMVSMSDSITMTAGARGGVMQSLKRSVLGRESFFSNTFEPELTGEVAIAPALPGDITALEVGDQPLLIQTGSFLAATPDVDVDTTWGGARTSSRARACSWCAARGRAQCSFPATAPSGSSILVPASSTRSTPGIWSPSTIRCSTALASPAAGSPRSSAVKDSR